LIKPWLECPVEEADKRGRKIRTTVAKDSRCGIPKGSPVSPLLANLYLRRFVLAWKKFGLDKRLGSVIVTYPIFDAVVCKILINIFFLFYGTTEPDFGMILSSLSSTS
jgi:RNA-directed DNA polymerase